MIAHGTLESEGRPSAHVISRLSAVCFTPRPDNSAAVSWHKYRRSWKPL